MALAKNLEVEKEIIFLNGLTYKYKVPMTVMSLLSYVEFNTRIIVVDYNGQILPKDLWQKTNLKKGDSIEILTIAGGG